MSKNYDYFNKFTSLNFLRHILELMPNLYIQTEIFLEQYELQL